MIKGQHCQKKYITGGRNCGVLSEVSMGCKVPGQPGLQSKTTKKIHEEFVHCFAVAMRCGIVANAFTPSPITNKTTATTTKNKHQRQTNPKENNSKNNKFILLLHSLFFRSPTSFIHFI